MRSEVRKYSGVIAIAAAFIVVAIFRGDNLSDPMVRKELIYCSAAIAAAVIINIIMARVLPVRAKYAFSYIGWLLISLSVALKLLGPAPFFDLRSSIGLIVVFVAGLLFLIHAYLPRSKENKIGQR
ncbi:MAG: hypothetical protein GF417_07680 [Candidatus Latescibacteria bacterium]|nr:hypothetical protein [bacterium]MBD3424299.1 hypothetical protein [Candidatus Latescibacterota bacterium]